MKSLDEVLSPTLSTLSKLKGTKGGEYKKQERHLENRTCQEALQKMAVFLPSEENAMSGVIMDCYVHRNMLQKSIEQSVLHNHGR